MNSSLRRVWPSSRAALWLALALGLRLVCVDARADAIEYLSDVPERLVQIRQDWGELGYDVAAHAGGVPGQPLRIGAQSYAKGLGHHANGAIHVLLDAEFNRFEAAVGLQPCASGSVRFRVLIDGTMRFDSGVMQSGDAPKPIDLPLTGAQELVLEASDTGDGISCDMANWADARLHRAPAAGTTPRVIAESPGVDIAPFGRVVTWDPNRLTGTRADRTDEFPAGDLFLDTEVDPDANGRFTVPTATNRLACIGLQWLNRRAVRELQLEFVDPARLPATNTVRVEGWFGESAWQGEWKPLAGDLSHDASRLVFRASAKPPVGSGLLLTRKIRWVWPVDAGPVLVKHPAAFTRSRWTQVALRVETDRGQRNDSLTLGLENGAWVNPPLVPGPQDSASAKPWLILRPSSKTDVTIRANQSSAFRSDPTLLRIHLNQRATAIAIEDVLERGCVYVPEFGLLVSRADRPVTLAAYQRQIAGRRTVLEEVRAMPDQTLAQAMARTHHDFQREGPVLLSLAADNAKAVVERNGIVRFSAAPNLAPEWLNQAGELRPEFGPGVTTAMNRQLEGGWLPIPVMSFTVSNMTWTERAFVAPVTNNPLNPDAPFAPRHSVAVVEFTVTNTSDAPAPASLRLHVRPGSPGTPAATMTRCVGGYFLLEGSRIFGRALTEVAVPLTAAPRADALEVQGTLPAHGTTTFAVVLPADPADLLKLPPVDDLRAFTRRYWEAMLAPATRIDTPDVFLNDLIRSSQVRCLIDARNEEAGDRIAAWIAAMSYGPLESEAHAVIRGMDVLGHTAFAQRGLDYFIHRYNTNGFLTTGYTTFGTAWHLWTLGEHAALHADPDWLRRVAPEVKRVGAWVGRQLQASRQPAANGRPEAGLMPPGVMADWNAYAYHFCLDAYYAAGLRTVGEALVAAGDPDGGALRMQGARLAAETRRAFLRTQGRSPVVPLRNGTWVPYYPSQLHSPGRLGGFFPGDDAGRSWCYDVELGAHQLVPTGVLNWPADASQITPMLDHMEDEQFLADGWFDYPAATNRQDWFNLGGFSKVQPYYTRNVEIDALRDDVKPFIRSYFNTLAAMVNPEVMTMWEHFRHSGAWDKTHETGYFLHQTRTMLVTERDRDLWLAPFVTGNWLKEGMVVSVANAPTRFGPVSFRLESHVASKRIVATITPPTRQSPQAIQLRVRHPDGAKIRSVQVNGRRHRAFAGDVVTLPGGANSVEVEVKF